MLEKALKDGVDSRIYGSRARGDSTDESDIDVMIELGKYDAKLETGIDELVFLLNLKHGCFISTVMFGRREIEEGPLGESPLYKSAVREGVRM